MATARQQSASLSPAEPPVAPDAAREEQMLELVKAFKRVFRGFSSLRGRDTHLGAGQLSHAQLELLLELYERGELSAGQLACAAQLTPATVTQMLEHLAACGHVERTRSGEDRRVVVTRLTPQGRRKVKARRDAWRQRWQEALADVPEEDLRAATRVLQRLCAVVGAEPGGEVCEVGEGAAGGPAKHA